MNAIKYKSFASAIAAVALVAALGGCGTSTAASSTQAASASSAASVSAASIAESMSSSDTADDPSPASESAAESAGSASASASSEAAQSAKDDSSAKGTQASSSTAAVTAVSSAENGFYNADELFSNRDLTQGADTSDEQLLTLESGRDITISEEGVYVVTGSAENATIVVDADESAKVQIVLSGVDIVNEQDAAIYVKSADKVFVTLEGENHLAVTGTFAADGDTNVDAVVFSKEDLVLNGTGSLTMESSDNGITSKDDLKVTGGTYDITAAGHCLEANDSIRVADGNFTLEAGKDGLHASNDDDPELGYVYIGGGDFYITAYSDGIHGASVVQIDGGVFDIDAPECIEGTYVQVNGGDFTLYSDDDGINASYKSTAYTPTIEINGGNLSITMAQGDTDALDSNGYLYINGGTVDISAQFAFDFEYGAELNGGTVYVNGEQVTEITESMMMGGGMGGGQGSQGGQGFGGGQGGPQGGGQGGPGMGGGMGGPGRW